MNKIHEAFAHGKAFIPFITCGDPDLSATPAIVRAMQEAGADLIELGIPFSDPTAEGPVIQAANLRALSAGTTTDKIFQMVDDLRQGRGGEAVTIPMVFMTYANVVYSYGTERFLARCRQIGMDGLILPDVPYEERGEFAPLCDQFDVPLTSMIAPTSHDRISMIAREAKGFIYLISSLGVTGVRSSITTDLDAITQVIRSTTDVPCAIGFGISTPAQAHAMAEISDGAIVGSAIMRIIAKAGRHAAPAVGAYVREMKNALR